MDTWKKNLSPSQINLMQEIIDQVPTAGGVQALFIDVLNDIGGTNTPAKVRYYLVNADDDNVTCTNDDDVAEEAAESDSMYVIDVQDNMLIQSNGDRDPIVENLE